MDTCPSCRHPAKPRATNSASPFCSERCRLVDLGKWLNEVHSIPAEESPDDVADAEAS